MSNGCGAEFPFFGAIYNDARCVDGYLQDLDNCDSRGNFYKMTEQVPCPFCNKEEFKEHFDFSEEEYQHYIKRLQ